MPFNPGSSQTPRKSGERNRQRAGAAFEDVVAHILNSCLRAEGISVVRARRPELIRLISDKEIVRQIIDYTRLPVKPRCDQKQLQDYPDSDLYALVKVAGSWRVLAIINCKLSFHARHTETTFWGLAIRISSYIKYVCVTEDKDIYTKTSELGASCEKSSAARRLLESFTDRVYIVKHYPDLDDPCLSQDIERLRLVQNAAEAQEPPGYPLFDDPGLPRHTQYCSSVRPWDDLITDLRRWREEAFPR